MSLHWALQFSFGFADFILGIYVCIPHLLPTNNVYIKNHPPHLVCSLAVLFNLSFYPATYCRSMVVTRAWPLCLSPLSHGCLYKLLSAWPARPTSHTWEASCSPTSGTSKLFSLQPAYTSRTLLQLPQEGP